VFAEAVAALAISAGRATTAATPIDMAARVRLAERERVRDVKPDMAT
jgi:malonyl CoA-acyl carrier protein transacylase